MEELEEDGLKNPTPSDSAPTPPETIADIVRSYKDTRGIVMTTGYWHFRFAFHAIHVIRTILKSELPIEIFYVGQQDLGELQISLLQQIPRVKVIDMSRLIDVHEPAVTGWAAKPYALLLSSFAEAIFVDADALFFQDPVVLFEQDAYKSTGVLLFRDRTITPFSDEPLKYFKSVVPEPSDYAAAGRLVRGLSQHDGESGVIVMNKIDGFFTLLLVCKMNSVDFRQDLWRIYHGDKETWWIAHELRKQPYAFNHPAGGAVGYPHPTKPQWVCGGLHHPDQDGNPLWFNGGIIANKYTHGGHNTLNLTVWATDYSYQDVEWEWETETSPFCMKPAQPSYRGQLKPRELEIARKMAQSWTILEDQIMNA
ncbi:mannosyltransferase putative-domain-containing protein [Polychytrium aggregatum]|uniref:mannosyltransferase putative-domain-containing protein n=1 Tax=Polychytrium aggregatum TaxID=110093 RepID=UPI0022FDFE40|nr:mannosyltransferase putative-domain-containing protein [Polychytrium aggregatum]KAI9199830.1 mannosyltransferase putative-domain-containing protein [Polychytrium aggregatum]